MVDAYLLRDRMERFTLKRGRIIVAWRIVDADKVDLVQPWFETKAVAILVAKQLGYTLKGELQ